MKGFLYTSIAILCSTLIACKGNENNNQATTETSVTTSKTESKANEKLSPLVEAYLQLSSQFSTWDSSAAAKQAAKIDSLAATISTKELLDTADERTEHMMEELIASLQGEAKSIVKETTITEQRQSFYVMSNALELLLKTAKYNERTLYKGHCPMAFNDEDEANWLSATNEVVNPYLGNKHPMYKAGMLHCGEIVDSLGAK